VYDAAFTRVAELCLLRADAVASLERNGRSPGHIRAVTLVLSELATNALAHASPPYELTVEIDRDETLVEVMDGGDGNPFARTPAYVDGGYGLNLVNALASTWGAERAHRGKKVWAAIDRHREL
jgi:two-component sensor histidine kinase